MLGDYRIADGGIILGNVVFLLLFIRRYRERRRQAAAGIETRRETR